MIVAVVIVVAMFVPLVLLFMDVVSIPVAIVAAIGILLLAGWGIDRNRRLGARDPFLDANRPDLASPMGDDFTREPPAAAIERPSDRRLPG